MPSSNTSRLMPPWSWLLMACIYYLCMNSFYLDIGQNMGSENIIPSLVPIILALEMMQFGTGVSLFSKPMLPNLVTGLAWATAFPLLYFWTYNTYWYQQLVFFDFLVGTSEIVLLTSLGAILMRTGWQRLAAVFLALLNFLLLIIPFMQYAYYVMFWHCLSPASLMAVYLTNYRESMDFIHSNVGPVPTLLIVCGIGLFLWWAYRCHLQFARRMEAADGAAHPSQFVSLVLVFLAAAIALRFTVPETSIAGQWKDVNSYVEQTQTYSVTHDDRFAELKVDGTQTLAAKAPGTVIVVIGESASRNYMKAFTPDYAYDNTPWLSQMANNGDFTLFQNVYSSWSQTVPVLQRVLTEQSQYNDKEFFESNSIVDVAKKAGYHTYWFSNQGRYGQYDSAITLVAKTADVAAWTDDSYNFSDKYDEELLPYLAQVDPTQNNFLVLHIMGSHIYYNNRYPKDYEVFQTEDGESSLSSEPSYANSILYTDHVLQQIYEYAKQNLHLQAMLYFSDHGENLAISHNPDVFSFDMVRIPMFVYLSPEYRAALPTQALALWGHRSRYFTNDMLYDTISGLLNAPSNHYDAGQDLSSQKYRFHRKDLTTMLGEHNLLEDPDGGPEQ